MGWFDFDLYATIGAKLNGRNENTAESFFGFFISNRQEVLAKIADMHPEHNAEIQNISVMMQSLESMENIWIGFINEFNALQDLFAKVPNDIYASILCISQFAYMYYTGGEEQERKADLYTLVKRTIELDEEPVGIASLTLLVTALWFSDYEGFRNKVELAGAELVRQGFFNEDVQAERELIEQEFLISTAREYMDGGPDFLDSEPEAAERLVRIYLENLTNYDQVELFQKLPFAVHDAFAATVLYFPSFLYDKKGVGFVPVEVFNPVISGLVAIANHTQENDFVLSYLDSFRTTAGMNGARQVWDEQDVPCETRSWSIAYNHIDSLARQFGWVNPNDEKERQLEARKLEAQKREEQSRQWRAEGRCAYCGGEIKGLFGKKCVACGKAV